jgi:hypothetical protein
MCQLTKIVNVQRLLALSLSVLAAQTHHASVAIALHLKDGWT